MGGVSRKKGGGRILVGADTVDKTGFQVRFRDGEKGSSEGAWIEPTGSEQRGLTQPHLYGGRHVSTGV